MLVNLINRISVGPRMGVYGGTLAACGMFQVVRGQLDVLYAASKYPVDYATGQLAFSAERLAQYYAHMEGLGTLGVYYRTQLFDFVFILCMVTFGVMLSALMMRFAHDTKIGRPAAYGIAFATVGGAMCDAIENMFSFVLLAQNPEISTLLALMYSSFAALKFGLLTLAMVSFAVTVIAILIEGGAAFVREIKEDCAV